MINASLTHMGSPRGLDTGGQVFSGPQHPGKGPLLIHVNLAGHLFLGISPGSYNGTVGNLHTCSMIDRNAGS